MRKRFLPTMMLLAFTAGGIASADLTPTRRPPNGVRLIVQFDTGSASVLKAWPTKWRPSGANLRKPVIDQKTWRRYPAGSGELLVCVYDKDGKPIETYAWPSKALVLVDGFDANQGGALRGRAVTPRTDQRLMEIPLDGNAHFLAFFRTEVLDTPAQLFPVRLTTLSVYDVEGGSKPPKVLHRPAENLPSVPPPGALQPLTLIQSDNSSSGVSSSEVSSGQTETSRPSPKKFDILVLGDGFANELSFNAAAYDLKAALLGPQAAANQGSPNDLGDGIEPFRSEQRKITFHYKFDQSSGEGVAHCWNDTGNACDEGGGPKPPFWVEGQWEDELGTQGGPGYFGTKHLDAVFNAKQAFENTHTELEDGVIDLVIMLANCRRYGGNADMENGIVYLPLPSDNSELHPLSEYAGLVAHEVAHVVAGLGEEYVSCVPPDRVDYHRFPNIAFMGDVRPKEVPWRDYAEARGAYSSADEKFKVVHTKADGFDCACEPFDCLALPDQEEATCLGNRRELGLFWGAMYASCECSKPPRHCPQSLWCDASPAYFRPMSRCRMQRTADEFCDVCKCLLRLAIAKASGQPLSPEHESCGRLEHVAAPL